MGLVGFWMHTNSAHLHNHFWPEEMNNKIFSSQGALNWRMDRAEEWYFLSKVDWTTCQ